jgi:hypothetical protein
VAARAAGRAACPALLHSVAHGVLNLRSSPAQIAKASSSNAIATRRLGGSSAASS